MVANKDWIAGLLTPMHYFPLNTHVLPCPKTMPGTHSPALLELIHRESARDPQNQLGISVIFGGFLRLSREGKILLLFLGLCAYFSSAVMCPNIFGTLCLFSVPASPLP